MANEIKKFVVESKRVAIEAYKVYQPQVENLVRSQSTDDNKIQLTLDYILGFCYDGQMLLLYKKLCRYYLYVNAQATADYINYYREMWDSDEKSDDD